MRRCSFSFERVLKPMSFISPHSIGPEEKPLPLPPGQDDSDLYQYFPPAHGFAVTESGRTNVPLIRLAQNQPQEDYEYSEYASSPRPRSRLTTITERTERTEDSRDWMARPRESGTLSSSRVSSSLTTTTDYGQIIGASATGHMSLSIETHGNQNVPGSILTTSPRLLPCQPSSGFHITNLLQPLLRQTLVRRLRSHLPGRRAHLSLRLIPFLIFLRC